MFWHVRYLCVQSKNNSPSTCPSILCSEPYPCLATACLTSKVLYGAGNFPWYEIKRTVALRQLGKCGVSWGDINCSKLLFAVHLSNCRYKWLFEPFTDSLHKNTVFDQNVVFTHTTREVPWDEAQPLIMKAHLNNLSSCYAILLLSLTLQYKQHTIQSLYFNSNLK